MKGKTLNLLEDKIGDRLHDFEVSEDVLNGTQKSTTNPFLENMQSADIGWSTLSKSKPFGNLFDAEGKQRLLP